MKHLVDIAQAQHMEEIKGEVESSQVGGLRSFRVSLKNGREYDLPGFSGFLPKGTEITIYLDKEKIARGFSLPNENFYFVAKSDRPYEFVEW